MSLNDLVFGSLEYCVSGVSNPLGQSCAFELAVELCGLSVLAEFVMLLTELELSVSTIKIQRIIKDLAPWGKRAGGSRNLNPARKVSDNDILFVVANGL